MCVEIGYNYCTVWNIHVEILRIKLIKKEKRNFYFDFDFDFHQINHKFHIILKIYGFFTIFFFFFCFQINTNQRYTFQFRPVIKFVIPTTFSQFYNFTSNMNWSKGPRIPVNNVVEHGVYNILWLNSLHETDKPDKVYNRYNIKINSTNSLSNDRYVTAVHTYIL